MGHCSPDVDPKLFQAGFDRTISRGPDDPRIIGAGKGLPGSTVRPLWDCILKGCSPLAQRGVMWSVTGRLKRQLRDQGRAFQSDSDREILPPLYREYGVDMFRMLDAAFALILFDCETQAYIAARDPIGIRPLYYGYAKAGFLLSGGPDSSLEARVPFGDLDFVTYVMSVDPELKLNKYLLRHAFEGDYLPQSSLYREKAAFSDAVGHSMVDYRKESAESRYTDEEFERKRLACAHARPFTKEPLLYREIFEKHCHGQSEMSVDFWMPNRSWEGCDVNDPSARVPANYDDSGK